MVILCDSCGARFHFDGSLIEGTPGARLRCRRCGGLIEVRNPEITVGKDAVEPPRRPSKPAEDKTEKAYTVLRTEELAEGKEGSRTLRNVSLVPYAALALGIFLLGIGGLGYIGLPSGERKPEIAAVSASVGTGVSAPSVGRYEFEMIETYYCRNRESGNLFILKGRVADAGGAAGNGRIWIHARLLNADKKPVAEKTVYAGVMVPDKILLEQDRISIEQALSGSGGEAPGKRIPPDRPIPFMVVFFDAPRNVISYQLAAGKAQ